MSVVKPDVILIHSGDEEDGSCAVSGGRSLNGGLESVILISSDDDDDDGGGAVGERSLNEGLELEHDGDYRELDGHESDKEEEDDAEKSNEEECLNICDERHDRSDSFKQGDAREGDIVLFKQHVYLGGKKTGKKRTVAGRIVKVRECGSKDKHKFVIKVLCLWTTHFINLRRRFTLLVTSHNLYKFGTFRQPWKNEAKRSKLFEEKYAPAKHKRKRKTDIVSNRNEGKVQTFEENHAPAKRKRKLRKTDIDSNKNKYKGTKRQKVAQNIPSSSTQPTQIAKHKSSKRKGASAAPVKEKTKKGHKRKPVQPQKTKAKKSNQQTFQLNPNSNRNLSPSLSTNPNSNPISSTTSNQNTNTCTNINQKQNSTTTSNLSPHTNPNPNTFRNPYPNTCTNLNPNPHSDSYMYRGHQLPYDTTFRPNPPPFGFLFNQPPSWFSPNQPPSGFPGYGVQRGPNQGFVQPPGYYDFSRLIVQSLMALCYQQLR